MRQKLPKYFNLTYITTGKLLKFGVYPKQGQFMPFYATGINFNYNDFQLGLNNVRTLNNCLLSPTMYQALF